jgi:hypothetical protein
MFLEEATFVPLVGMERPALRGRVFSSGCAEILRLVGVFFGWHSRRNYRVKSGRGAHCADRAAEDAF